MPETVRPIQRRDRHDWRRDRRDWRRDRRDWRRDWRRDPTTIQQRDPATRLTRLTKQSNDVIQRRDWRGDLTTRSNNAIDKAMRQREQRGNGLTWWRGNGATRQRTNVVTRQWSNAATDWHGDAATDWRGNAATRQRDWRGDAATGQRDGPNLLNENLSKCRMPKKIGVDWPRQSQFQKISQRVKCQNRKIGVDWSRQSVSSKSVFTTGHESLVWQEVQ